MQNLTTAHIEVIVDDVSRDGITFSHLRDELIDHICCQVEAAMRQGLSFEAAYEKTKQLIGHKGLKKIQEDTLLLINKKYRIMKKTMKTIGLVSMALITIGALFKIQHWPGAGILMTLGFLFLGTVFMPSALWVMKKESKLKGNMFIYIISIIGCLPFIFGFLFKIQHWPGAGIMLTLGFSILAGILLPAILITKLIDPNSKHLRLTYIIGYFALANYLMGDLFKIQHWPGASIMLVLGAVTLTAVFFPMYVMKVYKKAESIKASFLFLCVGIVFFNMFNLLLALNVSKNVLGYFIKPGNEIMKTTAILEKKNNMLVETVVNDSLNKDTILTYNIKKVKQTADELCLFIEKGKTDLISALESVSENEAIAKAKDPASIMAKDNYGRPTDMFCGTAPDGSNGRAAEIKKKIQTYKEILLSFCAADENAQIIISKALETKDSEEIADNGKPFSWEMYNFYHLVTIGVMNKLSYFQRNVRIAESEALESIKSEYQVK